VVSHGYGWWWVGSEGEAGEAWWNARGSSKRHFCGLIVVLVVKDFVNDFL
jgi:hypothetical protein